MFPAINPHFNYPIHRGLFEYFQALKLTDTGAAFYNEKHDTSCLAMGTHLGYIKWDGKHYQIFNTQYHPMGASPSKFEASEGLLKLYIGQSKVKGSDSN